MLQFKYQNVYQKNSEYRFETGCPAYRQPARSAKTTGLPEFSLVAGWTSIARLAFVTPSTIETRDRRLSDVGEGPNTCVDHLIRWTTAKPWSESRWETTRDGGQHRFGDRLASNSQQRVRSRLAARRRRSSCAPNFSNPRCRDVDAAPPRRRPSIAINVDLTFVASSQLRRRSFDFRSCRRDLASSDIVSPLS